MNKGDLSLTVSQCSLTQPSGPVESAADSPKAALEVILIALAVSEAGAR